MRAEELVKKQREYFESGVTLTYTFRLAALGRLHDALERYEKKLCNALYQDLHKSASESCMAEICMTYAELSYCTKRLARWMRQEYVKTKLANFPACSFTIAEPYGVTLVMAPWNYPVLLCLEPLINAIAAGNCVILKPSAYAPHVSSILEEMIGDYFVPQHVAVVEGRK